ncbi:diacylglycerol kinase [Corynebacterium sp. zg-331]|uniref:diacylglycerol kinase n=1 Tax=unclassified Corynebacterium TaxID=2624378 RepID=UPI00128D3245|nr:MULTISPECIES: diacylglycerol kinase [unclassified Corynebacterium]MBC3186660.1 diacylglycerol kinase [Corynebacterium sp. zg-331]MPV53144.1 diacylglycerol kinase [Corynebacterium sp. zg331]
MSNDYQLGHREISRVAVLTNPAAAKGRAVEASNIAARAFYSYGVDVVRIFGSSSEVSRNLAREMVEDDSIDALVACGGNGFISLVLQEQAGSTTPLRIIPAGTGNDHAREYGIPLDARRAAKTIVQGFTTRTDLGIMRTDDGQQRYFGTIACAGFDSLVTDRTNRIPWPSGQPRYVLAILLDFINFHSLPTRITLDDGEVISDEVTLCAIGNTRTYGGGMQVCPDTDHYDGLFDITLVSKMPRRKAALNVNKIFSGDFDDVAEARRYRTRKVRVEMPGINAYADGDKYFACPVECEIVPGAGYYLVPRP